MPRAFWNGDVFISEQCWFTGQKVTWAKILAICQLLLNMPTVLFLSQGAEYYYKTIFAL